ncbi:MAG TPA: transcriptional repressor LexA [Candidatus Saccharimonadales bacterium]|nr:transcriptional repressor LexA [Candidatus Saccharimonadales bacterium]
MQIKPLTQKEIEAIKHIRNSIVHKGRTPSIRELMRELNYNSINSVQNILHVLNQNKIIKKLEDGGYMLITNPDLGASRTQTIDVPIVGVVACGTPIFAEENIEGYIPVSLSLAKSGYKHFLLHAKGDSMNEAGINDGDLLLIRQQQTAKEGDRVVALIDDEATVKEFHRTNDLVILKPKSTNSSHKPIILEGNFQIQGIVISVIPSIN